MAARFGIRAPLLFDGEGFHAGRTVEIADGRIVALHVAGCAPDDLPCLALPEEAVLAPGFIDIQVNGGGDALLNDDPSPGTIRRILAAHRRFGTTGLLPTLITDTREKMARLAACGAEACALPGVLGFHLEGPFINPSRKGAHAAAHIRLPEAEDAALLARFGAFGRSMVTLAPERLDPAFLEALRRAGLRIAVGHSMATADEAITAIGHGVSAVTHLFNAMPPLAARMPGIIGAAMADERLMAGVIADGLHVDPVALKAAFRAMGAARLILVSDAMPTLGGERGHFRLDGRMIRLVEGRLTDEAGTLAGAHLGMIDAVHNAVAMMGASLGEALVMASRMPARFLGLEDELGRIAPGYRASLTAFRGRDILATWIDGAGETHAADPVFTV
jgi:N-acetylglucosamine-6-phosphate deacetylase